MSDYGIAQICLNGHVITSKSNDIGLVHPFCSICGESIVTTCTNCNTAIQGSYRQPSQIDPPYRYSNTPYRKPLYCVNCGKPYPWTTRLQEATFALIDFSENLSSNEKEDFKSTVRDIVVESPKTTVSSFKFRNYAVKAGIEVSKGLRDVLIDIVSESVKKSIWG